MTSFEHHQHNSKGREAESGSDRQTLTTINVTATKLTSPAVRHRRVQSTCFSTLLPPLQGAPTGHILILHCASYPRLPQYSPIPILSTAPPQPRPPPVASFFFYCEMEPFSITQCCWPALYFTHLFFLFSLFFSGCKLIWEAQLLVDCPQRTPGHNRKKKKTNNNNKKPLANKATHQHDFIYVKYWDTSTI